jgi:hypothetical protein
VLGQITQVMVETVVLNDLMKREDLSRRKMAVWYWWIATSPRVGSAAYLASRPHIREMLTRGVRGGGTSRRRLWSA